MTTVAAQPVPRAGRVVAVSWVLQVGLALVFAGAGASKLAGTPEMLAMFAEIGAGRWLRYLVGGLEVAGAVGVLVPRLVVAAAAGLAALMVGATVTNLVVLDAAVQLPLLLLAAAVVVARLRRPAAPSDG